MTGEASPSVAPMAGSPFIISAATVLRCVNGWRRTATAAMSRTLRWGRGSPAIRPVASAGLLTARASLLRLHQMRSRTIARRRSLSLPCVRRRRPVALRWSSIATRGGRAARCLCGVRLPVLSSRACGQPISTGRGRRRRAGSAATWLRRVETCLHPPPPPVSQATPRRSPTTSRRINSSED